MKKIGIVGCGSIGSYLAKRIESDLKGRVRLIGICDIDAKKAKKLAKKLSTKAAVLSLDRLVSKADIVVEAASAQAIPLICKKAVEKSKDIMVMSVGGLIGRKDIFTLAEKKNSKIILPSGALCGMDGLKSASAGKIRKVTLTTRKPPQGLRDAPFVVKNNIDLDAITGETVVFEGTAAEAIAGFPKNVNVAALVSLIGVGAKKTRVKIVTSPQFMVNTHEVEVEGDFGRLVARTENVPFPDNPKTSFLAALSAFATLRQFLDGARQMGT